MVEHGDHRDFKFAVTVEWADPDDKPDCFAKAHIDKNKLPAHHDHEVRWALGGYMAFCKTCDDFIDSDDIDYCREYSNAKREQMQVDPHQEALIYNDSSIALTLYECVYTIWHRRCNGDFMHGPKWNEKFKLSEKAIKDIWGDSPE